MMTRPPPTNSRPIPEPWPHSPQSELGRNVFKAFSIKANRVMTHFGEAEYRHWVLRETDPHFIALTEHPECIPVQVGGRRRNHVLALWGRDGEQRDCLWDVTTNPKLLAAQTDGGRLPVFWPEVSAWCAARELRCEYVDETQLRAHSTYIDNWVRLLPWVHQAYRDIPTPQCLQLLERVDVAGQRLAECPSLMPELPQEAALAAALWLVYAGYLVADLSSAPVTTALQLSPHHAPPAHN